MTVARGPRYAGALPAKYVHLGEHAINYLHTGATTLPEVPPALDRGELLLCLHDGGGCAAMWRRQLDGLGAEHAVVALDMPAHGRSSGVAGLGTIDAAVELLGRFVDALRLRPFVLVAHGLGSQVAIEFAARQGVRVRGLVLIGAAPTPDLAGALPTLREIVKGRLPQQFGPEAFSPQTTPDVMREYFTAFVTTDPRVRLADYEAAHGWNATPACAAIAVPTLAVAGADDRLVPPQHTEAVAAAIRGARFATVPDAGHALPLEQPDALHQVLRDFLRGLP